MLSANLWLVMAKLGEVGVGGCSSFVRKRCLKQ